MDELSFRILNFILYSHLFFSNILGNINDEEMKLYTHGEITCIRMIEKNWEIIETILNEKRINNIKSFMNIIFDKIVELMGELDDMSTIDKRQKFETEIRNYIEQLINNQNEYTKQENNYNNKNERIKGSDPQSLVEILSENYSPFQGIYNKEDYPFIEMFLISKYPNMNELERCLEMQPDYAKNYCLLNQVFISSEEYGLIENIQNINKLVDYLYKKFNNKIERDKAKVMKITECFENEENLASAYRNIIDWQNSFVDIVINSIGPHSLLRSYLSQLNQAIHVQDATEEDLVKINNKTYNRVKEMISQYSMRDIFKNGIIDFKEFKKSIKFDFESI